MASNDPISEELDRMDLNEYKALLDACISCEVTKTVEQAAMISQLDPQTCKNTEINEIPPSINHLSITNKQSSQSLQSLLLSQSNSITDTNPNQTIQCCQSNSNMEASSSLFMLDLNNSKTGTIDDESSSSTSSSYFSSNTSSSASSPSSTSSTSTAFDNLNNTTTSYKKSTKSLLHNVSNQVNINNNNTRIYSAPYFFNSRTSQTIVTTSTNTNSSELFHGKNERPTVHSNEEREQGSAGNSVTKNDPNLTNGANCNRGLKAIQPTIATSSCAYPQASAYGDRSLLGSGNESGGSSGRRSRISGLRKEKYQRSSSARFPNPSQQSISSASTADSKKDGKKAGWKVKESVDDISIGSLEVGGHSLSVAGKNRRQKGRVSSVERLSEFVHGKCDIDGNPIINQTTSSTNTGVAQCPPAVNTKKSRRKKKKSSLLTKSQSLDDEGACGGCSEGDEQTAGARSVSSTNIEQEETLELTKDILMKETQTPDGKSITGGIDTKSNTNEATGECNDKKGYGKVESKEGQTATKDENGKIEIAFKVTKDIPKVNTPIRTQNYLSSSEQVKEQPALGSSIDVKYIEEKNVATSILKEQLITNKKEGKNETDEFHNKESFKGTKNKKEEGSSCKLEVKEPTKSFKVTANAVATPISLANQGHSQYDVETKQKLTKRSKNMKGTDMTTEQQDPLLKDLCKIEEQEKSKAENLEEKICNDNSMEACIGSPLGFTTVTNRKKSNKKKDSGSNQIVNNVIASGGIPAGVGYSNANPRSSLENCYDAKKNTTVVDDSVKLEGERDKTEIIDQKKSLVKGDGSTTGEKVENSKIKQQNKQLSNSTISLDNCDTTGSKPSQSLLASLPHIKRDENREDCGDYSSTASIPLKSVHTITSGSSAKTEAQLKKNSTSSVPPKEHSAAVNQKLSQSNKLITKTTEDLNNSSLNGPRPSQSTYQSTHTFLRSGNAGRGSGSSNLSGTYESSNRRFSVESGSSGGGFTTGRTGEDINRRGANSTQTTRIIHNSGRRGSSSQIDYLGSSRCGNNNLKSQNSGNVSTSNNPCSEKVTTDIRETTFKKGDHQPTTSSKDNKKEIIQRTFDSKEIIGAKAVSHSQQKYKKNDLEVDPVQFCLKSKRKSSGEKIHGLEFGFGIPNEVTALTRTTKSGKETITRSTSANSAKTEVEKITILTNKERLKEESSSIKEGCQVEGHSEGKTITSSNTIQTNTYTKGAESKQQPSFSSKSNFATDAVKSKEKERSIPPKRDSLAEEKSISSASSTSLDENSSLERNLNKGDSSHTGVPARKGYQDKVESETYKNFDEQVDPKDRSLTQENLSNSERRESLLGKHPQEEHTSPSPSSLPLMGHIQGYTFGGQGPVPYYASPNVSAQDIAAAVSQQYPYGVYPFYPPQGIPTSTFHGSIPVTVASSPSGTSVGGTLPNQIPGFHQNVNTAPQTSMSHGAYGLGGYIPQPIVVQQPSVSPSATFNSQGPPVSVGGSPQPTLYHVYQQVCPSPNSVTQSTPSGPPLPYHHSHIQTHMSVVHQQQQQHSPSINLNHGPIHQYGMGPPPQPPHTIPRPLFTGSVPAPINYNNNYYPGRGNIRHGKHYTYERGHFSRSGGGSREQTVSEITSSTPQKSYTPTFDGVKEESTLRNPEFSKTYNAKQTDPEKSDVNKNTGSSEPSLSERWEPPPEEEKITKMGNEGQLFMDTYVEQVANRAGTNETISIHRL